MRRLLALVLIMVSVAAFPAAASFAATAGLSQPLRPALAAAEVCVGNASQEEGGCIAKSDNPAMLCLQPLGLVAETGLSITRNAADAPCPRHAADVPRSVIYELDRPPRA